MLIRFNVENFLSFNDNQEFSMIPGKTRTNSDRLYYDGSLKLLKFAALYGANASGKSNLIKAIDFAKTTILNEIPSQSLISFSKVKKDNINRNSSFDFEIELNGKYYSYGFEILLSKQSIKREWLYELTPGNDEKEIFFRDFEKGLSSIDKYFKSNKKLTDKLKVFLEMLQSSDSVLFLHEINSNKELLYKELAQASILKEIYMWFATKLDINYANKPIDNSSIDIFDQNTVCKIQAYLKEFGTGINKVITEEISREEVKRKIPNYIIEDIIKNLNSEVDKKTKHARILLNAKGEGFFLFEKGQKDIIKIKVFKFSHNDDDITFFLSEESDGTQRLLELLFILLDERPGKVFFIDEIDRSLHPLLTKKFVETFLQIAKERNVQLLVSTHESQLMDLKLLRKDEIWLFNKNNQGETKVYSMDEFNERFDKKIVKAYLEGRYRGIPEFHENSYSDNNCGN
ncbi:MAG: AAA family ATPase [Sphaerochaetaceae bacterium]|nr:AAA family ATPase [Sphaerochaetaceae bacterium]